jgi:hypothetical protein
MGNSIRRAIAAYGVSLAAVLGLSVLTATPAEALQCVWNNGGFVLRVDWFNPGTVSSAVNSADGYTEFSFAEQPVQTDSIWAPSGRCINRGSTTYEAVLSVCGAFFKSRVVGYPLDWLQPSRIDCSIYTRVTPTWENYLDVWGVTADPEHGPGGPIAGSF